MPGGTRSYELGRRLAANGHDVHMVTSDRVKVATYSKAWRKTSDGGMTVHWIAVPYGGQMSFFQKVTAFLRFALLAAKKSRSLGGDVVFATSTPLTIAIPALYASKLNRIPMVFEIRDLWPSGPIALGVLKNPAAKALARWLESYTYSNSAQIVALAPGMKDEVTKSGYPPEKITVIPNGCDLDIFRQSEAEAIELRSSYSWLEQRPLVTYIGAIGRVNSVDYLVHLAKYAIEIDEEVRFVVIGAGAESEKVRALARELMVLDRNFFMLEQMSKIKVAAWFCAATMSIALVSGPRFIWKDATQNKYFDSLAAGRPVAANYDGWQAKLVSEEGAGIILDASDHGHAAEQLLKALRDKEWLRKAARKAAELAETQFSRDLHGESLEQVLKLAISAKRQ